jgi:hypothetical protein
LIKDTLDLVLFVFSFVLILVNLILYIFTEKIQNVDEKEDETKKKRFPLLDASVFSRIVFWWLDPLIITGYKREFTSEDMWKLPNTMESDSLTNEMEKYWTVESQKYINDSRKQSKTKNSSNKVEFTKNDEKKENEKVEINLKKETQLKKPSLVKCIVKLTGGDFALSAFFHLIEIISIYLGPFILGETIKFTENKAASPVIGYFFATLLFLSILIKSIFSAHHLSKLLNKLNKIESFSSTHQFNFKATLIMLV